MSITERIGLPFPRCTTYSQCAKDGSNPLVSLTDANDNIAKNLEGRKFQVPDTIHGTGEYITLRIVKNDSSGDLAVYPKILSFSVATKDDWGHRVDGVAATGGEPGKPMDDAYYFDADEGTANTAVWTTIPDNDLFYVVEEGPCLVEHTTGVAGGAVGLAVQMAGAGQIAKAVAADTVIGTFRVLTTDTSALAFRLIEVQAGVQADQSA